MGRPKRDVQASVQRLDAIQTAEAQSEGGVTEEAVVSRPKMPPVISSRLKLSVPGLDHENYHHHWFNDVGENISNRMEDGYTFVVRQGAQVGERTADYANSTSSLYVRGVGMGIKAYLMRIPKELWKARQAAMSQKDTDEWENYIKERVKSEKGFRGSVKVTER